MKKTPFFTVIVPTYNQAQYLGEALDSLIAQLDPDWEAIIINDGSTDNTPEVIETYIKKDKRFRAIHKENGGVASALNAGLEQARGEWICWLSSDDLFDKRKLAIHREWIARYPSCHFYTTQARYIEDKTGHVRDLRLRISGDQSWQLLEMLRCNFIPGNSICIRRDAWSKAGMFNEKLRSGQDYDMWLRLLALYPATYIPEYTCITRHHSLQAGRIFPKTGQFDSAKAAIEFLNRHSFAELVPFVDLNHPRSAQKAINKALEIAADPAAFIYKLGPHPALLLRIMEWLYCNAAPDMVDTLQQIFRRKAAVIRHQYSGTTFGFLWKGADVAIQLPRSELIYQQISPTKVAEANYWQLKSMGSIEAGLIYQYLEKHPNLSLPPNLSTSKGEVVIICNEGIHISDYNCCSTSEQVLEAARYLVHAGRKVLVVGSWPKGFGFIDGALLIGVHNSVSLKHAISLLTPIEALVDFSCSDFRRMPWVRRYIDFTSETLQPRPQEMKDILLRDKLGETLLHYIELTPVKKPGINLIFYQLRQHGKIEGLIRRVIREHITNSRLVRITRVVWNSLSVRPVGQWPNTLTELWKERQKEVKKCK
ncbi:glycosyltransferase family 2 protein [Chloroflexota bacterium]